MTPRILYLSPYWPHRATCASEIRALHIGRALQDVGHVQVVVVDAEGGGEEWANLVAKEFDVAYGIPVRGHPPKTWRGKLAWALNPRVLYPHGCGVDQDAMDRIARTANDFDIVWFCKLRTPNMFPRLVWPRSVVDVDDVPSTYEESAWRNAMTWRDRMLTAVRVFSSRRRDKLLGERFSIIGVCSETDRRYLESLGVQAPMYVMPNGFERPASEPIRNLADPPRLGFVGIFDYEPNLEGIEWFVDRCWPRIREQLPDARLRLMGRYSNGPVAPKGPGIEGLGWMPDAAAEIATWSAMIVPILTGAGTRGKIAHAFSLKCPVVSTALGAYGYEVTDGREILLGDAPDAFADACVRVIREPAGAAEIAERAWEQFLRKWTWDAIRPRVWAAAEHCLRRSREHRHTIS